MEYKSKSELLTSHKQTYTATHIITQNGSQQKNVLLVMCIRLSLLLVQGHTLQHVGFRGRISMYYGVFGGYTRWAVVFLIIFVLFFLLVPHYGAASCGSCGSCGVGVY
jgi:hypothetical protein